MDLIITTKQNKVPSFVHRWLSVMIGWTLLKTLKQGGGGDTKTEASWKSSLNSPKPLKLVWKCRVHKSSSPMQWLLLLVASSNFKWEMCLWSTQKGTHIPQLKHVVLHSPKCETKWKLHHCIYSPNTFVRWSLLGVWECWNQLILGYEAPFLKIQYNVREWVAVSIALRYA